MSPHTDGRSGLRQRTLSFSLAPAGCAFSSNVTTVSASPPSCIAAMCRGSLPSCARHRWRVTRERAQAGGGGHGQAVAALLLLR